MTSVSLVREEASWLRIAVFGIAIFLSAFLIFTVQPIFTKVVLPLLGGTPAIWSVAMVVFQGLLLGGYLYAHLLIRFLPLKAAIFIHIALTCVAFSLLPFAVSPNWGEPPPHGEAVWLIGTFVQAIGLPFFALSANAPLLQAWLAAQDKRINVYHFYAASNVGSFAALFAYPFIIEPFVHLPQQSAAWSFGFGLFIVMLATCGGMAWNGHSHSMVSQRAAPITWPTRLRWIMFAAVPSGLLIAATAAIQTDVSDGPILWLLPLAIFLLSFVFAFRDGARQTEFWRRVVRASALFVLTLTILELHSFAIVLGVALLAVLSVSMACHGALYESRPDEGALTEFYLFISLGGLIGGLFAALIAPNIFSWTAEYPLLLCAAMLMISYDRETISDARRSRILGAALLIGTMIIALAITQNSRGTLNAVLIMTGLMLFGIFSRSIRPAVQGSLLIALFALAVLPYGSDVQRSFFGVHRVSVDPSGQYRLLMHGSTIHGAQKLSDQGRPEPLTYYGFESPIGLSLAALRDTRRGAQSSIGIVGLGTGSMACHHRSGEQWTFFEIDPVIVDIARDRERFRFVSECAPTAPIILGDARLTVQKQKAQSFDYLLVDAFSSDAIPVHLVTKEAIDMFVSRLSSDGILAIHISNRYIDLTPVLARIAAAKGLNLYGRTLVPSPEQQSHFHSSSSVVAFATGPAAAAALGVHGFEKIQTDPEQALWTDHYTNVTAEIVRLQFKRWFSM